MWVTGGMIGGLFIMSFFVAELKILNGPPFVLEEAARKGFANGTYVQSIFGAVPLLKNCNAAYRAAH